MAVQFALLALFSASIVINATPLRRTCNPNFNDLSLSVVKGDVEWGTWGDASSGTQIIDQRFSNFGEWVWQRSGGQSPTYTVTWKGAGQNGLAVSLTSTNVLVLTEPNSNDVNQQFLVECQDTCSASSTQSGAIVGDKCTIKTAANGKCVTVLTSPNSPMYSWKCDGSASQTFQFQLGNSTSSSSSTKSNSFVAGSVEEDTDESTSMDLKALLRNSYIVIGLLGATIIGLIVLTLAALMGKGCLKGRSSGKYAKISNPKEAHPEMKSLHLHTDAGPQSERYSD